MNDVNGYNSDFSDGKSFSPDVGGTAFSINFFFYILIYLIALLVVSACSLSGTNGAKYIGYLVSPIAILCTCAVMCKWRSISAKSLFPVKTKPKYYLIGLLLIFGLMFSLSYANEYFVRLLELMGYTRSNSTLPDLSGGKVVLALIVIAVIPAIAEEILFRSLILFNVEKSMGTVRTIFVIGMCFSLYHGSAEQTIYQFICGCMFAFLALRSRAITPTVLIHFLNNAIIIIMYACNLVNEAGAIIMPKGAEITLIVLAALSLIGALVWLIFDDAPAKPCQKGGVKSFFVWAAFGIVGTCAIWVAGLFV